MRRTIFILLLILIAFHSRAGVGDSLSVGFGGGYTNYQTFRGEAYFKANFIISEKRAECKAGICNHSYSLTFDKLKGLHAESFGFFVDMAAHPFDNGVFTGLRWELINFNWFTAESKNRIRTMRSYTPTSLYTGSSMFLQLGYHLQLLQKLAVRVYIQPGFQQFKISNAGSSSGSYVQGPASNLIIEDHFKFTCNLNMSIEFRR